MAIIYYCSYYDNIVVGIPRDLYNCNIISQYLQVGGRGGGGSLYREVKLLSTPESL